MNKKIVSLLLAILMIFIEIIPIASNAAKFDNSLIGASSNGVSFDSVRKYEPGAELSGKCKSSKMRSVIVRRDVGGEKFFSIKNYNEPGAGIIFEFHSKSREELDRIISGNTKVAKDLGVRIKGDEPWIDESKKELYPFEKESFLRNTISGIRSIDSELRNIDGKNFLISNGTYLKKMLIGTIYKMVNEEAISETKEIDTGRMTEMPEDYDPRHITDIVFDPDKYKDWAHPPEHDDCENPKLKGKQCNVKYKPFKPQKIVEEEIVYKCKDGSRPDKNNMCRVKKKVRDVYAEFYHYNIAEEVICKHTIEICKGSDCIGPTPPSEDESPVEPPVDPEIPKKYSYGKGGVNFEIKSKYFNDKNGGKTLKRGYGFYIDNAVISYKTDYDNLYDGAIVSNAWVVLPKTNSSGSVEAFPLKVVESKKPSSFARNLAIPKAGGGWGRLKNPGKKPTLKDRKDGVLGYVKFSTDKNKYYGVEYTAKTGKKVKPKGNGLFFVPVDYSGDTYPVKVVFELVIDGHRLTNTVTQNIKLKGNMFEDNFTVSD